MSDQTKDGRAFTVRMERLYQKRTGEENAHGSRVWFARVNRVKPYTVSRWCKSGPPPNVEAHMETLEALTAAEQSAEKWKAACQALQDASEREEELEAVGG